MMIARLCLVGMTTTISLASPAIALQLRDPDACSYYGPFRNSFHYRAESEARSLDTGDLNNDGRSDIVVANRGSNSASVFFNRGGFHFEEAVNYGVGNAPSGIQIVDVNSDKFADIVVANGSSNYASVLLNDQSGSFEPQIRIPVARNVKDIAAADLNEDGVMDMAFTTDAGIAVVMGLGNAEFSPAQIYDVSAYQWGIEIADLNHDGVLDIVSCNNAVQTPRFSVLMGLGDGIFAEAVEYYAHSRTQLILLRDINLDGHIDVVTSNSDNGQIQVNHGRGNGTFETSYTLGMKTGVAMCIDDFTSDGFVDLLSIGRSSGDSYLTLRLMRGNPDGSYAEAEVSSAGAAAIAMAADDFNNDGHLDLAFAANALDILPGDGEGGFHSRLVLHTQHAPARFTTADFDHDGIRDMVTTSPDRDLMTYFNGIGKGDIGTYQYEGQIESPYSIDSGDINLDGHPDILLGNTADDLIRIYLGDGATPFASVMTIDLASNPSRLSLADVDLDGDLDILAVQYAADSVGVLLNDGAGNYAEPQFIPVGDGPLMVRVSDLNLDGAPDLVVLNGRSDDFSIILAVSPGEYSSAIQTIKSENPNDFAIADVNLDSIPDLVLVDFIESNSLLAYPGVGDGSFLSPTRHEGVRYPKEIEFIDLNHDAYPDLVIQGISDSFLTLYVGEPDGSYRFYDTEYIGASASNIHVLDMNDDGLDDLVAVTANTSSVVVLFRQNQCEPCPADLTNDGVLDIFDTLQFIELFIQGDLSADLNTDGQINFFDVSAYIALYLNGCGFEFVMQN